MNRVNNFNYIYAKIRFPETESFHKESNRSKRKISLIFHDSIHMTNIYHPCCVSQLNIN